MNPLVSLMTPVYNAMPYLADYLTSLKEQTWRPLEVIFADDGSEDDSVSHIESRIDELEASGITVKLLKLPHRSQAAAVNSALKEVTGEFLTWCDADDIMLPGCVEKKARFLMEHPETGMVRNDGLTIEGGTIKNITRSTKECDRHTQNIFRPLFLQTTYCFAGCYMVKTSLFDECYPDRNIPVSPEGQNLQLLLPPASRTDCGFVPEVLHYYYKRPGGHSSSSRSFTRLRARILNFSDLFRRILTYCECDREIYEFEIEKREKILIYNMNYSAVKQARESISKR